MKITCVIVTYNRLGLLKKVIASIQKQTYPAAEILVVDNCSNDDTNEYLQQLEANHAEIKHLRLESNTGGAGGFHYGIKAAYAAGADWIWVLDDDAVPQNNALEKLIRSDVFNYYHHNEWDEKLGFLASRVEWTDGKICHMNTPRVNQDWPEIMDLIPECVKLYSSSFVSTLINREAIETVGLPVKEFFIWYDDTEYTSRISALMPGYFIPTSRIIHHTGSNMRPLDPKHLDENSIWKFEYGMRNETAVLAYDQGYLKAILFIATRSAFMLLNKVKLKFVIKFAIAGTRGLFFNYKKYIEYPNVNE